jgi:hypothetical protein
MNQECYEVMPDLLNEIKEKVDLPTVEMGKAYIRFPREPRGYLYINHMLRLFFLINSLFKSTRER